MLKLKYYIPGITLILSGIIIILFPEILIALVASIVIMAGIGALFFGRWMSESEQAFNDTHRDNFYNDFAGGFSRFNRPLYRIHRKWF